MSDNKKFESLLELELMTLCVYGEARNQGLDGMLAVASVILNRSKKASWWGHNIKSVILKPWQFSCLNENDPNRKTLENIAVDFMGNLERLNILRQCWWVARGLFEGYLASNIGGATHYHTRAVRPDWKDKLTKITQIGDHIFYA